jgi:hypothetical protein
MIKSAKLTTSCDSFICYANLQRSPQINEAFTNYSLFCSFLLYVFEMLNHSPGMISL